MGKCFETAFAEYYSVSNAVGVGSGTEALYLAITALDIQPVDEIITVAKACNYRTRFENTSGFTGKLYLDDIEPNTEMRAF